MWLSFQTEPLTPQRSRPQGGRHVLGLYRRRALWSQIKAGTRWGVISSTAASSSGDEDFSRTLH